MRAGSSHVFGGAWFCATQLRSWAFDDVNPKSWNQEHVQVGLLKQTINEKQEPFPKMRGFQKLSVVNSVYHTVYHQRLPYAKRMCFFSQTGSKLRGVLVSNTPWSVLLSSLEWKSIQTSVFHLLVGLDRTIWALGGHQTYLWASPPIDQFASRFLWSNPLLQVSDPQRLVKEIFFSSFFPRLGEEKHRPELLANRGFRKANFSSKHSKQCKHFEDPELRSRNSCRTERWRRRSRQIAHLASARQPKVAVARQSPNGTFKRWWFWNSLIFDPCLIHFWRCWTMPISNFQFCSLSRGVGVGPEGPFLPGFRCKNGIPKAQRLQEWRPEGGKGRLCLAAGQLARGAHVKRWTWPDRLKSMKSGTFCFWFFLPKPLRGVCLNPESQETIRVDRNDQVNSNQKGGGGVALFRTRMAGLRRAVPSTRSGALIGS